MSVFKTPDPPNPTVRRTAASFISTLLAQTQLNSAFMASASTLKSKTSQKQGMQGQAEDN